LSFSAGRPAAPAYPTPELSDLAYPIDHHRYTRAAPVARENPAAEDCNNGAGAALAIWSIGYLVNWSIGGLRLAGRHGRVLTPVEASTAAERCTGVGDSRGACPDAVGGHRTGL